MKLSVRGRVVSQKTDTIRRKWYLTHGMWMHLHYNTYIFIQCTLHTSDGSNQWISYHFEAKAEKWTKMKWTRDRERERRKKGKENKNLLASSWAMISTGKHCLYIDRNNNTYGYGYFDAHCIYLHTYGW